MEGEQLWDCIQRGWEEMPESTIARAYLAHHQIVNAIYRDEGGDQHMKEKGGLHFGVRRHSVPYFDSEDSTVPSGVEMMEAIDDDVVDTLEASGLKYPTPDVSELEMGQFLSLNELTVLEQGLEEVTQAHDSDDDSVMTGDSALADKQEAALE